MAALEADTNLQVASLPSCSSSWLLFLVPTDTASAAQAARHELVPGQLKEEVFWRNYFYKCDLIVSSYLKMAGSGSAPPPPAAAASSATAAAAAAAAAASAAPSVRISSLFCRRCRFE
jgi:hypothetical protein